MTSTWDFKLKIDNNDGDFPIIDFGIVVIGIVVIDAEPGAIDLARSPKSMTQNKN